MRKLCILILLAPLLCASCAGTATRSAQPTPVQRAQNVLYNRHLQVGDANLRVQIVSNDADMRKGLSGRSSLPDDAGMLFDFKKSQAGGFWMKDMKFNLDFIWIADSTVIGITPRVSAPVKDKGLKIKDSDLPLYYSPAAADMVLEVNEGWAEKNKIKAGDKITIE